MTNTIQPYWTSDCGRVTVYVGDNLNVMSQMQPEQFHAVVTDPPYGLEFMGLEFDAPWKTQRREMSLKQHIKDVTKVIITTFFDVVFSDYNKFMPLFLNLSQLSPPTLGSAMLTFMDRTIWEEARVAVPERAINFNNRVVLGNEEVKDTDILTSVISNRKLIEKLNTHSFEEGPNFFLNLRPCGDAPFGDGLRCFMSQCSDGILRVPIVIALDSCFAGLLSTLSESSDTFLGHIVRFLNDSNSRPNGSSFVVTSSGAELRAMLSLDMRSGSAELFPTNGTIETGFIFELRATKYVGARPRASGLPTMFQSRNFNFVDDATNRTFSVCFHKSILSQIMKRGFMGEEWDAPWKKDGGVDAKNRREDEISDPVKAKYLRHNVEYVRDSHLFQQWFFDRAKQMLRVVKPGAHLLSFGGTRMYHRMACAVEDAEWEIRDSLMWIYGCLSEDTEILTKDGWKKYQELYCGLNVMTWNSETEELRLGEIQEVNIAPYKGKMFKFYNDNTDQLVTPNHRVYKKHAQRFQLDSVRTKWFEEKWLVKHADEINRYQAIKLPMAGYHSGTGIGGNVYAELLGWVFTEGGFDASGTGVRITQSSVNQDKVEMICQCLTANGIEAKHYQRDRTYKHRKYVEHTWFFSGEPALRVRESLPDKHPTWSLLWSMTLNEKRAFFNSAMLGDGSGMHFYQKDDADREWFQVLAHCIGMQGRDNQKKYYVALHDNNTTELQRRHLQDWYEDYDGIVWCVRVESGAFVARRNGKVFITGNSGFPKSMDISKQIDKIHGAERVIVDRTSAGLGSGQFTRKNGLNAGYGYSSEFDITLPATEDAKRWSGWGTGLKPAHEPIVMARKPMDDNTANNMLKHGCGGLNIDECRIGTEQVGWGGANGFENTHSASNQGGLGVGNPRPMIGRHPANILHDGSEEVVEMFPNTTSTRQEVTSKPGDIYGSGNGLPSHTGVYGFNDSGSAARFFYSSKADDSDRPHGKGKNVTVHPTVKPLDLMQYLVRLVCPRGGTVLDPFMGSGSTGCAAIAEGMKFVGIEQNEKYADIAVGRLKLALQSAPIFTELKTREEVRTDIGKLPPRKKFR